MIPILWFYQSYFSAQENSRGNPWSEELLKNNIISVGQGKMWQKFLFPFGAFS